MDCRISLRNQREPLRLGMCQGCPCLVSHRGHCMKLCWQSMYFQRSPDVEDTRVTIYMLCKTTLRMLNQTKIEKCVTVKKMKRLKFFGKGL